MGKNITIKDIAAEAGVSITLVSFVMNNYIDANGKKKYNVSDSTRERILEIAKRMNYQPNTAARTLRNGKSLVIGAILSDISNVFYGEIARLLENIAYKHGYTILFGSSDEDPEKMEMLIQSMITKGVEGFIIVPCEHSEASLRRIIDQDIPLVLFDRRDLLLPAPTIVLDNDKAMGSAVRILLDKGLRNIHMISYTMRVSSITEREKGYCREMREHGIGENDIHIHRIPFEDIDSSMLRLMPEILDEKVDGLVFATNSLTTSAIKTLFREGIKIQKDINLVGFDNSDVYGLFEPPIPHIQQPIQNICEVATSLLFKLINKQSTQEHLEIILESKVMAGL